MRVLPSRHAWQTAARSTWTGLTPRSSNLAPSSRITGLSRRGLLNWRGSTVTLPTVPHGEGSRNAPFMRQIPSQDYLSRIRLMPPSMTSYDVEILDRKARRAHGEEQGVFEVHCLPFWTMLYLSHTSSSILNTKTGETLLDDEMIGDFGFTIAAVSKDHWAYGTISYYHPRLLFTALQGDYYHMGSPDSTEFCLDDTDFSLSFPASNYTPFQIEYPVMTKQEYCEIWKGPQRWAMPREGSRLYEASRAWTLLPDLAKPTIPFAVPMYRVVVRARYPWGDYLWDASPRRYFDGDNFDFIGNINLSHQSGYKLAIDAMHHSDPIQFVHHTVYKASSASDSESLIPSAFALGYKGFDGEATVAKQIMSALDRSRPIDWKDPNILPADLRPGNTLAGLIKYAGNRIMRIPTGPLPQAFQVETPPSRPLSSGLQSSSLSALRSSSLGRATRLTAKTSTGSAGPTPSATSRPSPVPPRSSPRPVPRPRALPPRPATPVRGPTQPATLPISDPQGYYSVLEIEPTTVFITQDSDKTATKQLNDARLALLALYHPDRTYSTGNHKNAMTEKYQAVADAHEALNTIEKRRKYSGK